MIGVILAASVFSSAVTGVQNHSPAKEASPVGDWRGMSVCQVRPSACHDEDSLYHVRSVAGKDGAFELQADKIVEGRPVTMGTSPCTVGSDRRLVCTVTKGTTLVFDVSSDEMRGSMKMADGTVWRKITLKRVRP